MRMFLVLTSWALLQLFSPGPSFCAPASSEEDAYVRNLTELVENNRSIIERCNKNMPTSQVLKSDLEDPAFEREVLAEVGLVPREEPPRTAAEAQLVVSCLLGISLRQHGVDVKEAGLNPQEVVKTYRDMIGYTLLTRGCATAEAAIEGLKDYFDKYRSCKKRYPDAIGEFYYRPEGVTLKAEKLTARAYLLSATHERCNVVFTASSHSPKIQKTMKNGTFPGTISITPLDDLLLRMQFYDLSNLENETAPPAPPAPPCP